MLALYNIDAVVSVQSMFATDKAQTELSQNSRHAQTDMYTQHPSYAMTQDQSMPKLMSALPAMKVSFGLHCN